MKKFLISLVGLTLLTVGAFFALGLGRTSSASTTTEAPPVQADNKVVAEASVVPIRSAALSLATGGVVAEVLVTEGDRVEANQALVRLNAAQQTAAVQQAERSLDRAKSLLAQLKARPYKEETAVARAALATAQANLTRTDQKGAVKADLDAARAEVESAQAQLDAVLAGARADEIDAAEAEIAIADAGLAQARAALAETELRAPFAGIIASLNLNVGEFAAPGMPLAQLADLSSWQIETDDLTELDVVKIDKDHPAMITFDALPDLTLPGKVSHIEAFGENKQGDITYTVTVKPDRLDERLHWNMTASVAIDPK